MYSNIIDTIVATLTLITVALSTWAAFSARHSAKAAQSQYELAKDDSVLSRNPIIIPMEFDYQALNPKINFTLDGENIIDNKFGDLEIFATNVSNANAFNVVSYLYVKNLRNYLDFVTKNEYSDPWLVKYKLNFTEKLGNKNSLYLQIGVENYKDAMSKDYENFTVYEARHRANPKMKLGQNETIQVTVNSYAQIILRDYINRRLNSILIDDSALVEPEIEIIFRYKTIDQLKQDIYTVAKYKVIFHQISTMRGGGVNFRLMYDFKDETFVSN